MPIWPRAVTDEWPDPARRSVDWGTVGAGLWRYAVDQTMQFVESPHIDSRHYREQERLYVAWVEGMARAGMPSPNLMVACLLWLAGIGYAIWLPRRWLWGFGLGTLAWMARAFFVNHREDATSINRSDGNPRRP